MDNFLKNFLSLLLHHLFNEFSFKLHLSSPGTKNTNATQSYHSYSQEMKLKPPFWRQPHSLVSSSSPLSPNKGELKFLPSSTPRIELVFGRFKVSPPRLGWGFTDTRFLLGTEVSSSKLLPISGSAAQRIG